MTRHKLDAAFDLPPILDQEDDESLIPVNEEENKSLIKAEPSPELSKLEQDLDNVRSTQYSLIEKGQESLEELIEFAKSSESPRAWEVVATLIKTTSEVANSLATVALENEKRKEVATKKEAASNVTNNTVFFGSTADLQKFLNKGTVEEDEKL